MDVDDSDKNVEMIDCEEICTLLMRPCPADAFKMAPQDKIPGMKI
jgi:hypothetical protein